MAKPEVIICPLNWGLGHASRMIPVAKVLQQKGFSPVLAASGDALELLKREFAHDDVKIICFPGKVVRYPKGKRLFLKLFLQAPSLLLSIWHERIWINRYVKRNNPCLLISDNRYGARGRAVFSVFIGHQLNILLPSQVKWMDRIFRYFNHAFIKSFDECWVPDFPGEDNLSGMLSHGHSLPKVKYTGSLSRFRGLEMTGFQPPEIMQQLPSGFITVVLSGPEPQRTILEKSVKQLLKDFYLLIFRGLPGNRQVWRDQKHIWFDHADAQTMFYGIKKSRFIISRSGYTTLMDLHFLQKKALLIPTPGQTEQEYLANYWEKKGLAIQLKQDQVQLLEEKINLVKKMVDISPKKNDDLLEWQVDRLISGLPCLSGEGFAKPFAMKK